MKKNTAYIVLIAVVGIVILLGVSLKWLDFFPALPKKGNVGLQEKIVTSDVAKTAAIPNPNGPDTLQLIIVPYFEPTSPDWGLLYEQADRNPGIIKYAIINPCSGPCQEPLSEQWQQIISELKKRNIKTLGYIFDSAQSIENIDYYMKEPSVKTDGIFFDNEGTSDSLERFRQYAEYVHDLGGLVYINPGFNYPYIVNYLKEGVADVANVYEFESSKSHHMEKIDQGIGPRQLSAMLGDVHDVSEMKRVLDETAEVEIGTVYVYSDSYYHLPPFFLDLIKESRGVKIPPN